MKLSKILTVVANKVARETAEQSCAWHFNQPKVPAALKKQAKQ